MADHRAERSRERLRRAFIELLDQKPFEKISVREVCEQADLSKKAFYNNYADINDLVVDCYHSLLLDYQGAGVVERQYDDARAFLYPYLQNSANLFEYYRAHPRFAKLIVTNIGVSPYFDYSFTNQIEGFSQYLSIRFGEDGSCNRPVDYVTMGRFVNGGWSALLAGWINDGMHEDSQTLAKRCQIMVNQCVALLTGRVIDPEYLEAIEEWQFVPEGAKEPASCV